MMAELQARDGVHTFVGVLKAANERSLSLLSALGFERACAVRAAEFEPEPDEVVMVKTAGAAFA